MTNDYRAISFTLGFIPDNDRIIACAKLHGMAKSQYTGISACDGVIISKNNAVAEMQAGRIIAANDQCPRRRCSGSFVIIIQTVSIAPDHAV